MNIYVVYETELTPQERVIAFCRTRELAEKVASDYERVFGGDTYVGEEEFIG